MVHDEQQAAEEEFSGGNTAPPEDEECEEVAPLSEEETRQFSEWLEKQQPERRKHYLKLAQAYGFPD